MTLFTALPASTELLIQLANSAARALVLSLIVALALVAFRVKSTPLRLFTWTAVLYAALAMPLLQWMLPSLPIHEPAFLQFEIRPPAAAHQAPATRVATAERIAATANPPAETYTQSQSFPENVPALARVSTLSATTTPATSSARSRSKLPWNALAGAIYLLTTLIFLARFFVGLWFSRRLKQAAQTIRDPLLNSKLACRARATALNSIPHAAESNFISVPLTLGALRSTILLPTDWREWDEGKLDAVLAHEVSHVARRDPLTQRISLLHRAIFWFSPLAWWLDRHLAELAEQASDEAALYCGADRKDYARTLLAFFESLQKSSQRVRWQGVAMAKAGQAEARSAEERLERILSWKGAVTMGMKKSIAALVLALAVPLIFVAASARPVNGRSQSAEVGHTQAPPPAQAEPSATPSAAPSAKPNAGVEPAIAPPSDDITGQIPSEPASAAPAISILGTGVTGVAPIAPVGPAAPVAAIAPVAPVASVWHGGQSNSSGSSPGSGFSYRYGWDDEQRFVIVSGKTDSFTMSGSAKDARHVEKLRKNIQGDFIWFQRDEKSYIVRDQATIDRVKKLWEPQEEHGKKQEELGKKQEALGKQQEDLGAQMEQVKVNVPDMTADLEKLKAELKELGAGATVDQVGHIQSEIGELQSKIGELQSHAGDQQSKLGELMSALGEQQGKLGEEQGELGRKQGELAQDASRKMKQIFDDAIAKGIAQLEM
jgi:beta-lactamase regulating signal transducer with metallopeptidase domain/predicted  nucleic acid-binding Zn-ribbon protein